MRSTQGADLARTGAKGTPMVRVRRAPDSHAYVRYLTFGSTHNISYSRFAPTSAVLPDGS
jgi:hypothetical protein